MSVSAVAPEERDRLAELGIERIRADNPGPLTLSGTNTWVLGRDPAYVIDPGPRLPEHVERVMRAVSERGGLGGVALTHDHPDHNEALPALMQARTVAVAAGRPPADVLLHEGMPFGPLRALATPGHAPGHFAFAFGRACFTGDAVLGEGSVFIAPAPGALSAYLEALTRLQALDALVLCPGHGPAVWDPRAKLGEYLAHRLERERLLMAALDAGQRTVDELLDAAWSDVPEELRPAAAVTLAAHLDKLQQENRLPAGVQRPT